MKVTNTKERLAYIMWEKNLRQVDLLNLCKPYCEKYDVTLNKSHLSQYLSGRFEPKQDKLTILALALDVSETWLMGYDVPRERPKDANGLSKTEAAFISALQSLNEEGKEKVAEYISDLRSSGKYKKHDPNRMVRDA